MTSNPVREQVSLVRRAYRKELDKTEVPLHFDVFQEMTCQ